MPDIDQQTGRNWQVKGTAPYQLGVYVPSFPHPISSSPHLTISPSQKPASAVHSQSVRWNPSTRVETGPTGSTTLRSIVRRQVITVISGLCRDEFPQWDHQRVDSVMCHIGNVIPLCLWYRQDGMGFNFETRALSPAATFFSFGGGQVESRNAQGPTVNRPTVACLCRDCLATHVKVEGGIKKGAVCDFQHFKRSGR